MELRHKSQPKALISLVPMIDVMLILLVFFMVTSTYLDLDMVPAVERADDAPPASATETSGGGSPLLIRLGPDGLPYVQGRPFDLPSLGAMVRGRLADDPLLPVIVLPSGRADMQALVALMDTATQAGATRLRVIRLEARP